MIYDMHLLDDDDLVVGGQIFVIDLKGISFGHIMQFTPSLIKYQLRKSPYSIHIKVDSIPER